MTLPASLAADDGISLVEILVAVTLLAVTMAAAASNVTTALKVARDSRESVLAANIVQYELERLRAIPFVDWVTSAGASGGTTTATEQGTGPDGQVYQVSRQATWVQAGATQNGCETALATASGGSGGEGVDYVRVSQTVTFPGRDIDPVTNDTIITPRLDFYDPYTGNLAVQVVDRDGVGTAGHRVVLNGPSGLEVALTDDTGCAFFAYLPVSSTAPSTASYDITIDTAGHVDVDRDVQLITDTAVVSAQTTTVRTYTYDLAATIRPVPTVDPPPAGCEPSYVDTGLTPTGVSEPTKYPTDPDGGTPTLHALVCASGGPAGWSVAVPINLGWTLHNPASTFASSGYQVHREAVTTTPPELISPLFPYSSGYSLHAGRCPTSDPTGFGASQRTSVTTDPGADVIAEVPMGLVTVTTVDSQDDDDDDDDAVVVAVPDREVWADQIDPSGCPSGERLYLGRTGGTGTLRSAVPYGVWTFVSAAPGAVPRTQPYSCGEVTRSQSCLEVRADQPVDPVDGYQAQAWETP